LKETACQPSDLPTILFKVMRAVPTRLLIPVAGAVRVFALSKLAR
jgi:hypothetical protein